MDYPDLFSSDLIEMEKEFSTQEKMLERISDDLYEKGFVTKSFKQAIMEREKKYPTGLCTNTINFAIPHTDVDHVKKPFVYVVKLKSPLPFVQMGTAEDWIKVNTIFVLGIKEPAKQVGLLSLIMEKLQDKQFVKGFNMISSSKQMETYLKNNFQE